MTYIENVLVCIAAPLFITMLCVGRKYRAAFVFCFAGMLVCLLSAYLNTFFTIIYQADTMNAATQIAPVVEEIMKLLPLLFFLIVFEPDLQRFRLEAMLVAASFATFENICYLAENGAGQMLFLLIRGFGTGAMHVVCGSAYSEGLRFVWHDRLLRSVCIPGLLCVTIIYHAIYNLLVSVGGSVQVIGYCVPLFTLAVGYGVYQFARGRQQRN
ncbi:MAG: PrsW family glutamic-type intramembrane protease [Clostridia bacterium]